jgi:hypothetical protein
VAIPAEGHPWSPRFPRGESSEQDYQNSSKYLRLLHDIQQRYPGISLGDAYDKLVESGEYVERESRSLDDFLDVHGGVTYYQHPWVGFDTAHSGDVWTGTEYDRHQWSDLNDGLSWSRTWTPELVAEEAKNLARQIAEIGRLEKQLEIPQEEISECGN